MQKAAPALVAAVASPPYLYRAGPRIAGPSERPVYYNDQLRNCMYNCDYCFLQGMHSSGNTLVFVNSEDFHRAAAEKSAEGEYWLSISYLTDIMAFERVLPLVSEWLGFARRRPDVTLEIRTKGEAPELIREEPPPNVVLVWSISPELIPSRYEKGCAGFQNRLFAAKMTLDRGWRIRLAVDPVILTPVGKRHIRI